MNEEELNEKNEIALSVDWHIPENMPTSFTMTGPLTDNRYLAYPLKVKIAYDDKEVVVSESQFHIHAVGATIAEALTEFRRGLSEELDELTADEEELGARLQAELQYLRTLIRTA